MTRNKTAKKAHKMKDKIKKALSRDVFSVTKGSQFQLESEEEEVD